ncbi:MAG: tetratricopeptide repeat protein [Niabella sp.]
MKWLTLIVILLQVNTPANNDNAAQEIKDGNRLYKSGNMPAAAAAYNNAINSSYRYIALFNKGNALYRLQKHEEAIENYKQSTDSKNKNTLLRSAAFYNTGVVYSSQQNLIASIAAYKNALRLNWKDVKARENLQKALLALKKQSGGSNNNQPQKQLKSNISQNKAKQQLDNLENKEKETQQKVSDKKGQYSGKIGKDW